MGAGAEAGACDWDWGCAGVVVVVGLGASEAAAEVGVVVELVGVAAWPLEPVAAFCCLDLELGGTKTSGTVLRL